MNLLARRRALMSLNKEKYIFVEYVESTGTQWIDTGYIPTENTEISMDFEFIQKGRVFGANSNSIIATYSSGTDGIACAFGNSAYSTFGPYKNRRYKLNYSKNGVYLDDNLRFSFSYSLFSASSTLLLCNTNTGTSGTMARIKLYSFKIYNNSILVRDFKPCYRKADKVGGLYDTVSGEFFENQGTGEFLIGGEI